jgi:hypothetical protein
VLDDDARRFFFGRRSVGLGGGTWCWTMMLSIFFLRVYCWISNRIITDIHTKERERERDQL